MDVSIKDTTHERARFSIISRNNDDELNLTFKYARSPEGLKYWHSDQWHVAT